MLRTNVYLTAEQEREINLRAAVAKKPKAAVLRDVIDQGLKTSPRQKSASAEAFVRLGEMAKKFKGKVKGPKDLSQNIDKYLWDSYE